MYSSGVARGPPDLGRVLCLRRRRPDRRRAKGFSSSDRRPKVEYAYVGALIAAAVAFYVPFVHFSLRIPGMHKIYRWLEDVFNLVVSEKDL